MTDGNHLKKAMVCLGWISAVTVFHGREDTAEANPTLVWAARTIHLITSSLKRISKEMGMRSGSEISRSSPKTLPLKFSLPLKMILSIKNPVFKHRHCWWHCLFNPQYMLQITVRTNWDNLCNTANSFDEILHNFGYCSYTKYATSSYEWDY